MRLNETDKIMTALSGIGLNDLHLYNAEGEYLKALKGVTEPEQKELLSAIYFWTLWIK